MSSVIEFPPRSPSPSPSITDTLDASTIFCVG
jgi:hypothetical protein